MSYTAEDIIKVIVVIVGIILILSGFVDLANLSFAEQLIESIFGMMGTGLLKIIVGGILVLAVVYPDAITDFIDVVTGHQRSN